MDSISLHSSPWDPDKLKHDEPQNHPEPIWRAAACSILRSWPQGRHGGGGGGGLEICIILVTIQGFRCRRFISHSLKNTDNGAISNCTREAQRRRQGGSMYLNLAAKVLTSSHPDPSQRNPLSLMSPSTNCIQYQSFLSPWCHKDYAQNTHRERYTQQM